MSLPRRVTALAGWLFLVTAALGAGLTGVVLRTRAAGTLLPVDADRSVGFRGGQGGL
jgi:hypothetical protein